MKKEPSSIDRDIFQHQVIGVAEEMSFSLRRTAYSSVIWEALDYACAVFNEEGKMLAQADTIPALLGIMSMTLQEMLRIVPKDKWKPGDVYITNDPYRGGSHTMDIVLFSPIFSEDTLIGFAGSVAHHIDIGGKVPCTMAVDNTEVFGEGLLFPPIRLVEEGEYNQTMLAFISSNVRDPRACIGDLRAQIAACRMAERRMAELAKRYGQRAFRLLSDECLRYGEQYVRGVIATLPKGVHKADVFIEDGIGSPEDIRISVSVTITEDAIVIDFEGTSAQRACALNCPWASTVAMANYAVKCLIAPELAQNFGMTVPVDVRAPLGSLLNPKRPAATGNRNYAQQAAADAVLKALVSVFPQRSSAGSQISFPVFRAGGIDDRAATKGGADKRFLIMDILGGGMGASMDSNGLSAVDTHSGNCGLLSAEIMETFSPIRVRSSSLIAKSGGNGKHRGGCGLEREYEVLAREVSFVCPVQQGSEKTAPWGVFGGENGRPARVTINAGAEGERHLPPRCTHQTLRRGDRVRVRSAGGGGFGAAVEVV